MLTLPIRRNTIPLVTVSMLCFMGNSFATESWPGESWKDALQLGGLNHAFSNGDISGAHWNNTTNTLWLADNKEEKVWSLIESGSTFVVDTSFEGSGDFEGITQALDDSVVYVMDEDNYIRAFDASTGSSIETWDLTDALPSNDDGDGPEGITFVPDSWLSESGFQDDNGDLYTQSKNDFGGIFLVAHQNGGALYAFDLASNGDYSYIGQYDTARSESSGLAFDRSTGILYISHNTDGNTLETTDLTTTSHDGHREFVTKSEFDAPNDSNLEGFAIKQAINSDKSVNDVWAFYADDDGDDEAILVFKDLTPTLNVTAGDNQTAEANSAVETSPEVQLTDKFNNKLTDIEINFSISQGGGSLKGETATTDDAGIAELLYWFLGESGIQEVIATTGSISTYITASITGSDNDSTNNENTGEIIATASGDDGNVASNSLADEKTRWAASGEQWLQLDFGSEKTITGLSIAFYKGDTRSAIFDIASSNDGVDWEVQLDNVYSAGETSEAEAFFFDHAITTRYIRYVGHGNDSSSKSTAKWNSITEISVLTNTEEKEKEAENENEMVSSSITNLSIDSVSNEQSDNPAANLFDGVTSDTSGKRWSAEGLHSSNQWVIIDMGDTYQVTKTELFPFSNRDYQYLIQISSSADGDFTTIVDRSDNTSSDNSLVDAVSDTTTGRYLRLEVQGANDYSGNWVSINELTVEGILK